MRRARTAVLICALAGAGAAAIGVSGPVQANNACSICTLPPKPPETDSTIENVVATPEVMTYWACKAAKDISCDMDDGKCWAGPILGRVIEQAGDVANQTPRLLACGQIKSCDTMSPLMWIFLTAAALTLVVDAGRALVTHYSRWTDVTARGLKIGIVTAILLWAQTASVERTEGLGPTMWQWTGNAVAMGGMIGRQIGVGIQDSAGGGSSESSARCSSIIKEADWVGVAGSPRVEKANIRGLTSWSGVARVSDIAISEAADMGAILTGVAITLIPSFSHTAAIYAKMAASMVTFDFSAMMEILRVMFAVTLAGTAITIMLSVAFMILEAVVIAGITVGLLPIIATMWIWEQTRSASKQALAALLYAVTSLTVLGVTLEITYLAVERSIGLFTAMMIDPYYPAATAASELRKCGLDSGAVTFRGSAGNRKAKVTTASMYDAYKVYLCLHKAEPTTVKINDVEVAKRKKENQFAYKAAPEGESVYIVAPTRVTSEVVGWLPALIILVGAGVIANAVMRYASAGASELSGYRAPTSQVASQIVGAGKSFATWGGGKFKGMIK